MASQQLTGNEQQKEWKEIPLFVIEVIGYVRSPGSPDGNRLLRALSGAFWQAAASALLAVGSSGVEA